MLIRAFWKDGFECSHFSFPADLVTWQYLLVDLQHAVGRYGSVDVAVPVVDLGVCQLAAVDVAHYSDVACQELACLHHTGECSRNGQGDHASHNNRRFYF